MQFFWKIFIWVENLTWGWKKNKKQILGNFEITLATKIAIHTIYIYGNCMISFFGKKFFFFI